MNIINKARLRRAAIELATALRPAAGFNRVSTTFVDRMEAVFVARLRSEIMSHPSKGKTLK